MTDPRPTPTEIEAGMRRAAGEALERYLIGLGLDPTLIRPYAAGAVVLAAVLPDHDARVRADERARVAEEIARAIEADADPPGVILMEQPRATVGAGYRRRAAAIARQHATRGEPDRD